MKKREKNRDKTNLVYRLFKWYVRFFHDKMLYKNIYIIGTENIPVKGTPTLIVSNHQNNLNDPLGILFSFGQDRKPHFITRGDIFASNKWIAKFLLAIGLLPSYRLAFEGEESLAKNEKTFLSTEKELLNGGSIMLFPEAGHQDKRWLGNFSLAYLKLAFETAEKSDFKQNIEILPSCNHYSSYFGIQNDLIIKFGTPISMEPYYALYQEKPRTAKRQINAKVREQIESLMLDIRDLDNYKAIDYLRESYRFEYAKQHQLACVNLVEQLVVDKAFIKSLDRIKQTKEAELSHIYKESLYLKKELKKLQIEDRCIEHPTGMRANLKVLTAGIFLFPLWLISLWPHLFIYLIPGIFVKKMPTNKDQRMWQGTFIFALGSLFLVPISYLASFGLVYAYTSGWIATIYLLLLPSLGLFAWYYRKAMLNVRTNLRYIKLKNSEPMQSLIIRRNKLYKQLNTLLE